MKLPSPSHSLQKGFMLWSMCRVYNVLFCAILPCTKGGAWTDPTSNLLLPVLVLPKSPIFNKQRAVGPTGYTTKKEIQFVHTERNLHGWSLSKYIFPFPEYHSHLPPNAPPKRGWQIPTIWQSSCESCTRF